MLRRIATFIFLIGCSSLAFSACDASTGPDSVDRSSVAKGRPEQKDGNSEASQAGASSEANEGRRRKAQASEKEIVSGLYEGLLLGIGPKGELTGFYSDGVGDNGAGGPQFSCVYFLNGEAKEGGGFKVTSWYPEKNPEGPMKGEINSVEDDGRPGVNLKLDSDPCAAMLASGLETEKGADYLLDSKEDWIGVRVISAAKAFFYSSPDEKSRRKAFVVENEVVALVREQGEWAEVDYVNEGGDSTRAWMKTSDFFTHKL